MIPTGKHWKISFLDQRNRIRFSVKKLFTAPFISIQMNPVVEAAIVAHKKDAISKNSSPAAVTNTFHRWITVSNPLPASLPLLPFLLP